MTEPVEVNSVPRFAGIDSRVEKTNYIIRPSEKKTLATIVTDVTTTLHLPTNSDDLSVYDLNGNKIRTFRKLYDHSASTFILKRETNVDVEGDIFEQAGIGPRLRQSRDRSTANSWIFGNSGLIVKQPKQPKQPKLSKAEKGKKTKSRPSEKKNERKAKKEEAELNESDPNEVVSARKGSIDKEEAKKEQERAKELQTDEKVPADAVEKRPSPVSQIEARLAQVRILQDRMMEGESYLDKIGQRDPKQQRFNPFVLFGGGDIDWENKKESSTNNTNNNAERPSSAIPKFVKSAAPAPDQSLTVEEDPDIGPLPNTHHLIRPQTVVLRRANPPNLAEILDVA